MTFIWLYQSILSKYHVQNLCYNMVFVFEQYNSWKAILLKCLTVLEEHNSWQAILLKFCNIRKKPNGCIMWFESIFFYYVGHFFHPDDCVIQGKKFNTFMYSSFTFYVFQLIFSIVTCVLSVIAKKSMPNQYHEALHLCFLLEV